ncbi:unnamed protein product [Rotaria sp. Silwood2]|nr:unnamed protein product [Rotaria sp. Silwood2]CAF4146909.1 unnamed protein product [Rotaria sp. Silwood2]
MSTDEYVNIVWYDENLSDQMKHTIETIYYRLFECTNIEALQKTINDVIHDTEKILLILSGDMNHELVLSIVHSERHIVSIFILANNSSIPLEKYNKIYGIFTDYSILEKKMLAQARMLNHQAIALEFDEKLSEKSMEEPIENPEAALFDIHSRLSTDRFVTSSEKEKLLKYCRRRYASNSTQLKHIDEFERTYESKDALNWNGKKQREKENVILDSFHVYRGLNLPDAEIARIQNYRGKSIIAKGFLSTTKSLAVARMFAANVVLNIEIDPKLDNIIYADMSSHSKFSHEEEILIDFGTSFRVIDISSDECNIWTVYLVSVNEMDKVLDSYIDLKRLQGENDVMIATGLVFFGYKERACRLLRDSLNSTSDNREKFDVNCELSEIYARSSEFSLAADCLQEARRLCKLFDPYLSRLHSVKFWLSMMYACLNEHDRAFDCLSIQLEFPYPQPYSLPRTYSNSWTYLVTNEESLRFDPYRPVYEYLQRCLTTYKQDKDILYRIHFYISLILLKCNREEITLQSLDDSLLHMKQSGILAFEKSNNFLLLYYYHMGIIYESKERYHQAKRYYCKMLPILRCNGDQNENLTMIHVRIAACYTALKLHELAIQRCIRALHQSQTIDDPILVGKVRAHLGIIYLETNQYHKAIEQFIIVSHLIDIIERRFIDEIYLIIAETLFKVNDIVNAIKYYSKFLDRYEEIELYESELWFNTCERIIYIYYSENQFENSIIYAKRMLEFRMKICANYFDEILDTQLLVALCYQQNKEWQEAINYYNMAYDTLSKKVSDIIVGECNPLISDQAVLIQTMLAIAYRTINNYDQAIYHANIALETEEKRLSRDKITIASCYDFIGWCHYIKCEYDKALEFCTKGLHLLYTCTSESDMQFCHLYHSLGNTCLALGDVKQSITYCMKALYILVGKFNIEDKKYVLTYFFPLIERIRKLGYDLFSYSESFEIMLSEIFPNTTDLENLLNRKGNF